MSPALRPLRRAGSRRRRLLLAAAVLGATLAGQGGAAAEGDTLNLAPDLGTAGTVVTASGTGYDGCSDPRTYVATVALLWDKRPEPIATATVQDGAFSTSFQAPAEPGPHRVRSTCLFDGKPAGGTLAAAAFRVLTPTLALAPGKGAAGSELVAGGDEYPPACADRIVLRFDQAPLPLRVLERGRDPGEEWVRFQATTDVPATAGAGPHEVSVTCPAGGQAPPLAAAPFEVTVTATVPPTSSSSSTTLGRPAQTTTTAGRSPATTAGRPPATTGQPGGPAPPTTAPSSRFGAAPPPGPGGPGSPPPTPPPSRARARSAFPASVRTPAEVSTSAARLLRSLALTGVLVLLVGFPAEIFNRTLEENYAEVSGWLRRVALRRRARPRHLRRRRHWQLGLFTLLGAVLTCLVDPTAALDRKTAALAAGLLAAIPVTTLAYEGPIEAYTRIRSGLRGAVRVLPVALAVAGACVALSRLAHFQPGYVYGLFAGYAALRQRRLSDGEQGRAVLFGSACALAVSLLAWVAWEPVARAAAAPHPSLPLLVADSTLCAVFVMGVESTFFALIPLRFLNGQKLARWSRVAWVATFGAGAFCFVHVLLDTKATEAGAGVPSVVSMLALFAAFGMLSLAFWGYFRYRDPPSAVRGGMRQAQP